MAREKTEKLVKQKIQALGSLPFPIDMLRYDACFPAGEEDSGTIRDSIERQGVIQTYVVSLVRWAEPARPWTEARWQSFGWTVRQDPSDIKPRRGILR